ncbi:MAG: carbohydrate ABC transporter permease [Acidimicrobiales bacterium]|jgi:multiple sugar transport system permease protein
MTTRHNPRRAATISGVNLVVGLVIVGVMLLPIYWAVVTSLKTLQQSYAIPSTLVPPTPTLSAYSEVLHTQGGALLTSLIIAVGSTLLSLLIAVPAAHALANFRFRVTGLVTLVLLVTQTIPGIVLGISFFKIFAEIHLLNSYLGLIIADSTYCVPFDILVIRAFMIGLPHELLEAAYVDGATLLGSLVRIVLPLSRPAILAAALFSFLFSWGDFLFALTLNTSGNVIPMSLSIYQYLGEYTSQWPELMAAAIFAAIPSAILLVLVQRGIRGGIATAGLKG